MDSEMLEQNLKCPICLTIADEPYETSCCGHIFCSRCIKGINKSTCPICRSNQVHFRENTFVKNLLNTLQSSCPYGCDLKVSISNAKLHRYQCEASLFKCSVVFNGVKCNFEGSKKESLLHFAEKHSDQMIILAENFASLKNTYDKLTLFDKLLKIEKLEKEKEKEQGKEQEEYNELYFHEMYHPFKNCKDSNTGSAKSDNKDKDSNTQASTSISKGSSVLEITKKFTKK